MMQCGTRITFDKTSDECCKCQHNITCITKSPEMNCGIKDGLKCVLGTPIFINCELTTCDSIRKIFKDRKTSGCAFFGTPRLAPLKHCLSCDNIKFSACEANELLIKNQQDMSPEEAFSSMQEQMNELTGGDSCYGKFNNEDICKADCEFMISCMRKTGIAVGSTCSFFPNMGEGTMATCCVQCVFTDECIGIFLERESIQKEEEEENKAFRHFFTVAEIRNQLIIEED